MSYVDYKAQKGTIPQKYYRAVDEGVEEFKKEQNVYKPISVMNPEITDAT